MRVYIAGPMSGYEGYNFPAFFTAATKWREAGWEVINPAELDGQDTNQPWDFYLRRDLKLLVDCDAIAMLPDWELSKGAKLEHYVAMKLGLTEYDAENPVILTPITIAGGAHMKCIWCTAPMQRTGMCFTCIQCGHTSSC